MITQKQNDFKRVFRSEALNLKYLAADIPVKEAGGPAERAHLAEQSDKFSKIF